MAIVFKYTDAGSNKHQYGTPLPSAFRMTEPREEKMHLKLKEALQNNAEARVNPVTAKRDHLLYQLLKTEEASNICIFM